MQRAATSTQPEDSFVDLFREVFGLEKAQMLVHEFPYRDFLGNHRFVDYALKTTESQVAFEIDGPDHDNAARHQGRGALLAKFEDDLLRHISLIPDRRRRLSSSDCVAHDDRQPPSSLTKPRTPGDDLVIRPQTKP